MDLVVKLWLSPDNLVKSSFQSCRCNECFREATSLAWQSHEQLLLNLAWMRLPLLSIRARQSLRFSLRQSVFYFAYLKVKMFITRHPMCRIMIITRIEMRRLVCYVLAIDLTLLRMSYTSCPTCASLKGRHCPFQLFAASSTIIAAIIDAKVCFWRRYIAAR